MAYNPEPQEGKIYVNAKGFRFKVESKKEDGINVLKFKSDGTIDKPIFWPESKWNAQNLTLEGKKGGGPNDKDPNGG